MWNLFLLFYFRQASYFALANGLVAKMAKVEPKKGDLHQGLASLAAFEMLPPYAQPGLHPGGWATPKPNPS